MTNNTEILWAFDLDQDHWPRLAHQIVEIRNAKVGGQSREERVTACGLVLNVWNHPEGWWSLPPGKIPLQDHAVHCKGAS